MVDLDAHVTDLTGDCTFSRSLDDTTDGNDDSVSVSGAGAAMATTGSTWACPRGTLGGHDRCLFHLTTTERADLDITPDAVTDAFVTAARTEGPAVKQFLGADLRELDVSHQRLAAPDNYPIDVRYATVDGELALTNTDLKQPLRCDHADLGAVTITGSRVDAGCHFEYAHITGDVTLQNQFDRDLVFSEATVEGDFRAVPAMFELGLACTGTTFRGDVEFYADFNDEPTFTDAVVEGKTTFFVDINADSYFKDATFEGPFDLYAAFTGSARFNGATFRDRFDFYGRVDADAHFPRVTFEGPAAFFRTGEEGRATRFYQLANFDGATFEDVADFTRVEFVGSTDFEGTTFEDIARFDDTRFERRTRFVDVTFTDQLRFHDAVFTGTPVFEPAPLSTRRVIDFTDAHLSAGRVNVESGDPVVFDLTRTVVGEVDVGGMADGSVFDHFVINRTDFEGFDFSNHRLELARRDYAVHDTADRAANVGTDGGTPSMTAEDLEVTYLKAKNGAKAIDENEAVSQFFLREMRYRRRRHLLAMRAGDGLRERLRGAGRAVTNLVMGSTCGYGERPWRVVAASIGVVALFAIVYGLVGALTSYEPSAVGYAILSTETFVALVLGSPQITNPSVNLLTSVEAFSGAYFIALFVFTLTRSIRR
ncbi:pentapeptide repeat-containing protein [Halorarius litoreus]|uniref:pentapeptide repeat-containing protein n=1 Tax=Halorarius litoreus TaxID=2962676 RepID=UPI0020CC270F|nr:pentapeptide repeat-containing protein [Halorarius litoreus]